MKRVQLKPWTNYEKLCLASAIQRKGDQDWTILSQEAKNIFQNSSDTRRPPDWFSMKQCMAQYEYLLKNIAEPRRKKRTEKGPDIASTPKDIIINVLRQDCIEELKQTLVEERALYLKIKKENEDIEAGLLDDKLEEMLAKIEAKEREEDIRIKLKVKLGEKHLENDITIGNKQPELETTPPPPPPPPPQPETEVKPSSATSPLLTSLLQRPSIPSNISLLLNSTPSMPSNESPTLSKLLESPTTLVNIPQPPQDVDTATPFDSQKTPVKVEEVKPVVVEEVVKEEEEKVKITTPEHTIDDIVHGVVESEVVIEHEPIEEKQKTPTSVARRLDLEMEDVETEDEVMETVEQIIEKVEEAIIETVGETGDSELCEMGLNQTIDSENIEDHLESLDLDHEAVELIVMGPNQGPVIAVHHNETSSDTQNEAQKREDNESLNLVETLNDVETVVEEETKEVDGEPEAKEERKEEKVHEVIEPSVLPAEEKEIKFGELEKDVIEEHEVHSEVVVEEVVEEVKSDSELSNDWEKVEVDEKDKVIVEEEIKATAEIETKIDEIVPEKEEEKESDVPPAEEVVVVSKDEGGEKEEQETTEEQPQEEADLTEPKSQEPVPEMREKSDITRFKDKSGEKPDAEMERRRVFWEQLWQKRFEPRTRKPKTKEEKDHKSWKKSILLVYDMLATHRYGSVFLKPITEADAAGYHSVIRRPMDLTTIKRNIESGMIRTTVEFQRDTLLMVQNAIMYNNTNTVIYEMANNLLNDILAIMEVMIQAIGDGVPLSRDSYEHQGTRGRTSKSAPEDTPKRKRNSAGDEIRGTIKRTKLDSL